MKLKWSPSKTLLSGALCLWTTLAFTQSVQTVSLEGTRMRAPLEVQSGQNTLHLCNLTAGETYVVAANGAAYEQRTSFELTPSVALAPALLTTGNPSGRKNLLRFTAPAECVEIRLEAGLEEPVNPIPMFLSVKCASCPDSRDWINKVAGQMDAAVLNVQGGIPATDLIKDVLIGGDCFDVSNVTFTGINGQQIGTFANGQSNIKIPTGMIMATGSVDLAPGPNDADGASAGYGSSTPDGDLSQITGGALFDLASIEFDFVPTTSQVLFEYVFASEEYCEYVGTQYNDVFGFFISGPGIPGGQQNIARIPSTTIPVTINNVNHIAYSTYYNNNQPWSSGNLCGQLGSLSPVVLEIQYDGYLDRFVAIANVQPCQTYHIKLKIADVGDGVWDSAVFLAANSFSAGGTVSADVVYPGNQQFAYEGCTNGYIEFTRSNSNTALPVIVNFVVDSSSTAVAGVDYAPLNSPLIIPPGQTSIQVPVVVYNDAIFEGQESIVILVDNACACSQSEIQFFIQDNSTLEVVLADQIICSDTVAILSPVVTGGIAPYFYAWNTGDSTASITVSTAGMYTVTVTDECGATAVDSALVSLVAPTDTTLELSFCTGDSIIVGGMVFTAPGIFVDTLQGQNGACDTVVRYVLNMLPLQTLADTIIFCPGDSISIGGIVYTQSGTASDTLPGLNGACDTIVTYTLIVPPLPVLFDTITFCEGGSVSIGDSVFTSGGTVIDTLPGGNGGCDTIITYTLVLNPLNTRSETLALCPGQFTDIGGTLYSAPATVVDTLPGANGSCDTIVTYTLDLLPYNTRSETISLCPGQTVTIGGSAYTAPAIAVDTLPGMNGACDTIVTYTLDLLPFNTRSETISLCPGQTATIDGAVYAAPATVVDTLAGVNGACDTIATYTLDLLPYNTRSETIAFCPGETITIGGVSYNQPGTVVDTLKATAGCDTIVTYMLQFLTPAPSVVTVTCPGNVVTDNPNGVSYPDPVAASDCPCPGVHLDLTEGLPSGSTFPLGLTKVCYTATDSCGNTASCCFNVEVTETKPCDIKIIGCIKFELLSITQDDDKNTTFRIRVTNSCPNPMIYTAFELPKGIAAVSPAQNSVYTAPSGRQYNVRNPNFSPFYSIRFASKDVGISGGMSDIFEYTLPPRTFPAYIHAIAKVATQSYYEAYLNTFYCPIGKTPGSGGMRHKEDELAPGAAMPRVFPNPTTGELFADLSVWQGQSVQLAVFDSRGALVQQSRLSAESTAQAIRLPEDLAGGLYFLELTTDGGERQVLRFVKQ